MPAKILDSTINKRFYVFLEENNILHKNQFGFRKGYGTELAIAKIYEMIALNQRQKGQCKVVCHDIVKAFDKVWHEGLMHKIMRLQLPDISEKILCSFFIDRTAQIKISGRLSEKFSLRSAVPQGSMLAPTLYSFYTSDLPEAGVGELMFSSRMS